MVSMVTCAPWKLLVRSYTRARITTYLRVSHEDKVGVRAVLDVVVDDRGHGTNTLSLGLDILIIQSRINEGLHVRAGDELEDFLSEDAHSARALRLEAAAGNDEMSALGAGDSVGCGVGRSQSQDEAQDKHECDHGCGVDV
jgi:hypothetical protein